MTKGAPVSATGDPSGGDPPSPVSHDAARLRATLDSLLDPHFVLTAVRDDAGQVVDFRFDDANHAMYTLLPITREQLLGNSLLGLFPGVAAAGRLDALRAVIDTGVPLVLDSAPYDSELLHQQQRYDVRAVRLDDSVVITLRDVTDRYETHRLLADSEERHRLLAENAWDVVWTMSVDGRVTYISPSIERLRGLTPAEAMAQTFGSIHPPESAARVATYFALVAEAMANGTVPPPYRAEHEYYRKDGSIMLGELQVIPHIDQQGRVVQILGVTRDISERRHFETELNRLAVTDPLTGVWNRRQGESLFRADLEGSQGSGPALSLLLLDIDRFKAINDTHGHQIGDRVLIELAHRLAANLRVSDGLARWGGEEFVILLRNCPMDDAVRVAEHLRAVVADTPFEGVGTVTASIGVSEMLPVDDFADWVDRADRAMYAAKTDGRNLVRASRTR